MTRCNSDQQKREKKGMKEKHTHTLANILEIKT